MITLSAANKAHISSDVPWPVTFLEIIPVPGTDAAALDTHFRVSNCFKDLQANSFYRSDLGGAGAGDNYLYTASASLMSVGSTKNDLDIKEAGISVKLSGIPQQTISMVLSPSASIPIQGARVYVSMGFFNESTGILADGIIRQWSGYIETYSIDDTYNSTDNDNITVALSCTSNLSTLLESKNGRFTSLPGFQGAVYNDGVNRTADKSMEFTPSLVDWAGNFYKVPDSGGGKHLCTKYWEMGDISDENFWADDMYRSLVDDKLYNWYSAWAKPLADSIEKGTIKYYICKPFVKAWSQSMAFKIGVTDKRSRFGEFLEWLGVKLSR